MRLLFHSRLDPLKLPRDPLQGVAGTPSSSNAAPRPQRPYGLLGTGSPGRPPRPSHSFWALKGVQGPLFKIHKLIGALIQTKSVQQHYSSLSAFCCGNETNRQRRFLMDRRIIRVAANHTSGLCVMVVWQFVEALSLGPHQWTFHLVINVENVWTLTVLRQSFSC